MSLAGGPAKLDGLRIDVLGPLSISHGEKPLDVGPHMVRRLLALLTLRQRQTVSREEIIRVLWEGEPPATCVNLVQGYVSRLRAAFRDVTPPGVAASDVLVRDRAGYRLEIAENNLDLARFDILNLAARQAAEADDVDRAVRTYQLALECWRGPLLADLDAPLRDHPSAVAAAGRRVTAAAEFADLCARVGWHAQAVERLRDVLADEGMHEGLYSRLMLSLAATGQRVQALATYEDVRRRLAGELGVDPSSELQSAHVRILREGAPADGDPAPGAGRSPAEAAPERRVPDARASGARVPEAQVPRAQPVAAEVPGDADADADSGPLVADGTGGSGTAGSGTDGSGTAGSGTAGSEVLPGGGRRRGRRLLVAAAATALLALGVIGAVRQGGAEAGRPLAARPAAGLARSCPPVAEGATARSFAPPSLWEWVSPASLGVTPTDEQWASAKVTGLVDGDHNAGFALRGGGTHEALRVAVSGAEWKIESDVLGPEPPGGTFHNQGSGTLRVSISADNVVTIAFDGVPVATRTVRGNRNGHEISPVIWQSSPLVTMSDIRSNATAGTC